MDETAIAIAAAAAVVFLAMIVVPIIVTRKRLRNEWARYEKSKTRYEELQAKGIDPETMQPPTNGGLPTDE